MHLFVMQILHDKSLLSKIRLREAAVVYFPIAVVLLSPFNTTNSAYLPFDCSKENVFIDEGGEHCTLAAGFHSKTALDDVTDYTDFHKLNQTSMSQVFLFLFRWCIQVSFVINLYHQ